MRVQDIWYRARQTSFIESRKQRGQLKQRRESCGLYILFQAWVFAIREERNQVVQLLTNVRDGPVCILSTPPDFATARCLVNAKAQK